MLGLGAWGAKGQPLSLGQPQGALEGEGEKESRWLFVWCLIPAPCFIFLYRQP